MQFLRDFLHDLPLMPRDLKLILASLFTWGIGESLFLHLIPIYLKELGASPVIIGNMYGLVAVVSGVTAIPAGLLADRWGRRQMMLAGWLVGLAGMLLMTLANNLFWFGAGMVGYWLTAITLPAMSSYVAAGRGPLSPERALTLISAGFGLGTIVSPALGGVLATQYGFRTIFIIGGVMFGISALMIRFLRPQPRAAVARSNRLGDLLSNRQFVGFCLLIAVTWFVLYLSLPLAPNFLSEVRGLSLSQIGLLGSFSALGTTTLNLVVGRLRPRNAFLVSQALVGVYLLIMLQGSWFGWLALAYFARPAAFISRTLAEALATRVVQRRQWGMAFGTLETVATVGTILAPVLAGRLYAAEPARPFQISLILLPATMIISFFLAQRLSSAKPVDEDDLPEVVAVSEVGTGDLSNS